MTIEVIVEVRWPRIPLTAIKQASVDPYFDKCKDQFLSKVKELGFKEMERLTPSEVPIELVGGSPVFRCREQKDTWPVYQLGLGIFTCNIVPPYGGWKKFKTILQNGLNILFQTFPLDGNILKPEQLQLRYIDGFTGGHGLENYNQFIRDNLGISIELPENFLSALNVNKDRVVSALDLSFPVHEDSSRLHIKMMPGQIEKNAALIAEFQIITSPGKAPIQQSEVEVWLDNAHSTLRTAFKHLTSEPLKNKMGPEKTI